MKRTPSPARRSRFGVRCDRFPKQPRSLEEYKVGVPHGGVWKEILNSDAKEFGGSGVLNGDLKAVKKEEHGKDYSVTFKLPPLSVMVFEGEVQQKKVGKKVEEKTAAKELPAKGKAPSKAKKV